MKKFQVEQVYASMKAYRENRSLATPIDKGIYETSSAYQAVREASSQTKVAQLFLRATEVKEI